MTNQPTNKPDKFFTAEARTWDRFYSIELQLYIDSIPAIKFSFQTDADKTNQEYYGLNVHISHTDSIDNLQLWTKEAARIAKRMPQGFHFDADVIALLFAIESSGYKQVVWDSRVKAHVIIGNVQPSTARLFYPVINGWNARVFSCLNESRVVAIREITQSMDDRNLDQWIESGMTVNEVGVNYLDKPDDRTAWSIIVDYNPFSPNVIS